MKIYIFLNSIDYYQILFGHVSGSMRCLLVSDTRVGRYSFIFEVFGIHSCYLTPTLNIFLYVLSVSLYYEI